MGDGLAATIGAGDEVVVPVRGGAGFGFGWAADKTRPFGPAAGLAKRGAYPKVLAAMAAVNCRVIARSSDSLNLRNVWRGARKKVFL
jgi:hypothetical protein